MEIIFSIENPDTSQLQLAIGEAVTALATGEARADVYQTRMEEQDRKLRPEVLNAVLERTFGASKAKMAGTGVWLAGLVGAGLIDQEMGLSF